jgi:hypothetical protein
LKDYSNEWDRHLSDPDVQKNIKRIVSQLELPERFQSLPGSKEFNPAFATNEEDLLKLFKNIALAVRTLDPGDPQKNNMIKSKIDNDFRERLGNHLSGFPEHEKAQLLKYFMGSSEIKSALENAQRLALETVFQNETLREKERNLQEVVCARLKMQAELAEINNKIISLEQLKLTATNTIDAINVMLSKNKVEVSDNKNAVNATRSEIPSSSKVFKEPLKTKKNNIMESTVNQFNTATTELNRLAESTKTKLEQGNLSGFDFGAFLKQAQTINTTVSAVFNQLNPSTQSPKTSTTTMSPRKP